MSPQTESTIELAIENLQAGNFQEAKLILEVLLKKSPNDFDALNFLGFILGLEGDHGGAKLALKNALKIRPDDEVATINLIKSHYELGEFGEALGLIETASKTTTKNPALVALKANCFQGLGLVSEAIQCFEKALDLGAGIEVSMELAETLTSLGRYEAALHHYEKVIQIAPQYAEAWNNAGVILHNLKRYEKAIDHYDRAIQITPQYAEAWNNKGITFFELNLHQEALHAYKQSISLQSTYDKAWFNAANCLVDMGSDIEAIVYFEQALKSNPKYAEAWANKGSTLKKLKQYDDALACCESALQLKPLLAEAWLNKALLLSELGRGSESIECFEKAISINPTMDWAQGEFLFQKMKYCLWSNFDKSLQDIIDGLEGNQKVVAPFHLLSLVDDPNLHKKCAQIFMQNICKTKFPLGVIESSIQKEKISIGYFSSDFRSHAVSSVSAQLYELHDRNQFTVYAFSLQKTPKSDQMRERLESAFDFFIDVGDLTDLEIAQLSRRKGIDVAVDLNGYTEGGRSRIFSYRAAPVQVNYLGYAGTTGADYMDYIITDSTVCPAEMEQNYSEKIICLPHTFMPTDSKVDCVQKKISRSYSNLPEGKFVFCCFNNSYKINKRVLESWSRILSAVDNSVLWIASPSDFFKENILREFAELEIDSSRIVFAQRTDSIEDHLARISMADLFLDTNPYGAHSTAIDFLKAGVPVLAWLGNSFPSRVSASILKAIDLPELIMTTQVEYESKAIDLANNSNEFSRIKEKLAKNLNTAPLFKTQHYLNNLEQAYIKALGQYHAGLKPDNIYLS